MLAGEVIARASWQRGAQLPEMALGSQHPAHSDSYRGDSCKDEEKGGHVDAWGRRG
jgi:hypothetical protein